MRVGFLLGPEDVIGTIQALKNNTAGQMPLVTQKVVAHVLDHIDYDVHLENVRKVYKSKCDAMMRVFKEKGSSKRFI